MQSVDICSITKKVVGDSEIISKIINSGWLFQPIKFNGSFDSLRFINNFYQF